MTRMPPQIRLRPLISLALCPPPTHTHTCPPQLATLGEHRPGLRCVFEVVPDGVGEEVLCGEWGVSPAQLPRYVRVGGVLPPLELRLTQAGGRAMRFLHNTTHGPKSKEDIVACMDVSGAAWGRRQQVALHSVSLSNVQQHPHTDLPEVCLLEFA
jgi:hypothetical protein